MILISQFVLSTVGAIWFLRILSMCVLTHITSFNGTGRIYNLEQFKLL